jgi:glutamate racemase
MATLGFLHTAHVHVATFRALVRAAAPGAADVHVVDESLLADARADGVDAVRARVAARVGGLVAAGAAVVVCTCSTIGAAAEQARAGVPVVRVDRPMARAAVAGGGRVGVVAAVGSTVGPTRALLLEEAAAAGSGAMLVDAPCPAAWALFEAGDVAGYLDAVAAHVDALVRSGGADVVVLAQASMAPVADRFTGGPVPVLSSPAAAVAAAAALLRDAPAENP